MTKVLFFDKDKRGKHRLVIPYENINFLSLEFNRQGDTKKSEVYLKDGTILTGYDAWFTKLDQFIEGEPEEPQVKKIGF